MKELKILFDQNKAWAENKTQTNPKLFKKLSEQQHPKYLWIGCSDSRVPASDLLGLEPGDIFVHRNIANICPHTDFNCLSVLEYAINALGIEHVIVCGHYGCGGIQAACESGQHGLVDNWLRHIRDMIHQEKDKIEKITDPEKKHQLTVELNVIHQVKNVCHTSIVQNTWLKGQKLCVHGWVYDITTGLLKDLNCCISSLDQVDEIYRTLG